MNCIVAYPLTVCFYTGVLALVTLVASLSTKMPKLGTAVPLFISAILSIVLGLRGENVGVDTPVYAEVFERLASGYHSPIRGIEDDGFLWITSWLMRILGSANAIFLIYATITILLIVFRFWELRDKLPFAWCIFAFVSISYFSLFNGMRQWIAAAVVFYATRFIPKRKYITFAVLTIVAATYHNSALFAFLYLLFELPFWNKLPRRTRSFVAVCLVASPIVAVGALYLLMRTNLVSQYLKWMVFRPNFGVFLIVEAAFFAVVTFTDVIPPIHRRIAPSESAENVAVRAETYEHCRWTIYCLFALMISFTDYFVKNVSRLSMYFILFESVFIAMAANSKKNATVYRCIAAAICFIVFFDGMAGNSHAQMPYYAFWQ